MKDFRDLLVWQKAHQLTLSVYRITKSFPNEELYGLTSQLRRATASIPAKIAEGCDRSGDREFARFLQIAMVSASEAEYHLLLSRDLSYINEKEHGSLHSNVCEVKRILAALLNKLGADR